MKNRLPFWEGKGHGNKARKKNSARGTSFPRAAGHDSRPPEEADQRVLCQISSRMFITECARIAIRKALQIIDPDVVESLGLITFEIHFNCECLDDEDEAPE